MQVEQFYEVSRLKTNKTQHKRLCVFEHSSMQVEQFYEVSRLKTNKTHNINISQKT